MYYVLCIMYYVLCIMYINIKKCKYLINNKSMNENEEMKNTPMNEFITRLNYKCKQ